MNTKNIASIAIFGFIGGITAVGAFKLFEKPIIKEKIIVQNQGENHFTSIPQSKSALLSSSGEVNDFVSISEKTINNVVHVKTQFTPNYNVDPLMEFFWGGRINNQPQVATGSGVIISEDGYIVTNNHVIDNADHIEITLNDKRSYTAEVIGADPSTDLALIKIEEKGLPFISFGNSDHVNIGEWVLAVGNPFNLNSTVTAGIVSAKSRNINILKSDPNRDIFPLEAFIQTDAAVNPGNSGGALINTEGHLVGINTAIASQTGSYSGYSFAVPSNIVNKITKDLLDFGKVQRAYIGVIIENINQDKAEELGLKSIKGIYIRETTENGAAQEAGIKEGDIITKIGSVEINSTPELQEQIAQYRPGDEIFVSYLRDGKELSTKVNLRDREGNTKLIKQTESKNSLTILGATLKNIETIEKNKLKLNGGAKISHLETGALKNAGIKTGFIITRINKIDIKSASQASKILSETKGGVLIEGYYPNGSSAYYGFGL